MNTKNDPINPLTIDQLSDDELDALVTQKRERRLRAFHVYQEAQIVIRERRVDVLSNQLTKALAMFAKELDRADKMIDKLDKRAMKIRGIRLEMGEL